MATLTKEQKIVKAKSLKEQLESITGRKVKLLNEAVGIFKTQQELLDALKEVGLDGKIKFGKGEVIINGTKIKPLDFSKTGFNDKDFKKYKKDYSDKLEKALKEVIKEKWDPIKDNYSKIVEEGKKLPKIDFSNIDWGTLWAKRH